MVLDLFTITIAIIVTFMFYLITSIIIREVGEFIIKIPESTFHKASDVSGALSGLIFLQFLLGDIWFFKELILIIMLIVILVMTHFIYDLDWKEASLMTFSCIIVYVLLLALISLIVYLL